MKPDSGKNRINVVALLLLALSVVAGWQVSSYHDYLRAANIELNAAHDVLLAKADHSTLDGAIITYGQKTIKRLSDRLGLLLKRSNLMIAGSDYKQLIAMQDNLDSWIENARGLGKNNNIEVQTASLKYDNLSNVLEQIGKIIATAESNINLMEYIANILAVTMLLVLLLTTVSTSDLLPKSKKNRPYGSEDETNIKTEYSLYQDCNASSGMLASSTCSETGAPEEYCNHNPMHIAHNVMTQLLEEPGSVQPIVTFLKNIEGIIETKACAIFISTDINNKLTMLACTNPEDRNWPDNLSQNILFSFAFDRHQAIKIIRDPKQDLKYICVDLPQGTSDRGLLLLKVTIDYDLTKELEYALKEYAEQLANIVYSARLSEMNLRYAQYEERSAISRELHDSLAQSLSYLKIQTSRLQNLVTASDSSKYNNETISQDMLDIDDIIQDIRMNINVAYRHLREIISTFRISTRGRNFSIALKDSIREFSSKSIVVINSDNRLPGGILSVAEEIQLLHIIREALSNIIRHSQATCASVIIHYEYPDIVSVTVEDDGIGLPSSFSNDHHYGIIIMQERTHALNGDILIENRDGGGTRLSINFRASNHS